MTHEVEHEPQSRRPLVKVASFEPTPGDTAVSYGFTVFDDNFDLINKVFKCSTDSTFCFEILSFCVFLPNLGRRINDGRAC